MKNPIAIRFGGVGKGRYPTRTQHGLRVSKPADGPPCGSCLRMERLLYLVNRYKSAVSRAETAAWNTFLRHSPEYRRADSEKRNRTTVRKACREAWNVNEKASVLPVRKGRLKTLRAALNQEREVHPRCQRRIGNLLVGCGFLYGGLHTGREAHDGLCGLCAAKFLHVTEANRSLKATEDRLLAYKRAVAKADLQDMEQERASKGAVMDEGFVPGWREYWDAVARGA